MKIEIKKNDEIANIQVSYNHQDIERIWKIITNLILETVNIISDSELPNQDFLIENRAMIISNVIASTFQSISDILVNMIFLEKHGFNKIDISNAKKLLAKALMKTESTIDFGDRKLDYIS